MVRLKGGVKIQEGQDLRIMAEPLWPHVCLIPQGDRRCAEGDQPSKAPNYPQGNRDMLLFLCLIWDVCPSPPE